MAVILQDCPHCGARHATFPMSAVQNFPADNTRYAGMSACPACHFPLAFVLTTAVPLNLAIVQGDIAKNPAFRYLKTYPERQQATSPEFVPEAAADAYKEGVDNAKDGRYSSAVMMFRRAIDVGTKQFEPAIDVHNLGKRIDKLAAEGLITKDLKEWAHKIRLEGNEAVHEIPKPTKVQTEELQEFTELILVYLFTLPAKVKANMEAAK